MQHAAVSSKLSKVQLSGIRHRSFSNARMEYLSPAINPTRATRFVARRNGHTTVRRMRPERIDRPASGIVNRIDAAANGRAARRL